MLNTELKYDMFKHQSINHCQSNESFTQSKSQSYYCLLLQDELRICVLPGHLSYDSAWPVRKIPLRMTPYQIAYDPENKVS